MPRLAVLVVHDPSKADDVGEAWVRAGVTGMTLLDSCGWAMAGGALGMSDDMPLFPSVRRVLRGREEMSRVLFTVVSDDFNTDGLVSAAESILGPLSDPHTGIFFVIPVFHAVGLQPADSGTPVSPPPFTMDPTEPQG
jgi:hypothetical protein